MDRTEFDKFTKRYSDLLKRELKNGLNFKQAGINVINSLEKEFDYKDCELTTKEGKYSIKFNFDK